MDFQPMTAATAEAVWEALQQHVRPGRQRELALETALGMVLARDVRSEHDFPPFDRSVMDGFAVRAADFAGGQATLRIAGLLRAAPLPTGQPQESPAQVEPLAPGTCMQINTGAPVPSGADAVVIVENAAPAHDGHVQLTDQPKPGQNIERRAALVPRGDLLARAGTRIQGGTIAALAAGAVTRVACFARPQVAILSTGDELAQRGEQLKPGQIHDTNSVLLEELVRRCGAETVMLGRCPDEPAELRAALELGLSNDLLLVSGGMSKGTHDLAPSVLEQLGVHWLVTSLDLKPGKPTRIGRSKAGGWVVGLPGNPVSCAVCFLLFARPILDGLQGLGAGPVPHLEGRLEADMPINGPRPVYQPAEWYAGVRGRIGVMPLIWRGSSDPFGMATANALIYRPARAAASPRGDTVRFVPLDLPR